MSEQHALGSPADACIRVGFDKFRLGVEQEVGALAIVLERTPYPLAIELAAIAARHAPQMQPPWALQPWLQVTVGMGAHG